MGRCLCSGNLGQKTCAWCSEAQSNPQTHCSEVSVTVKELGLVFGVQKRKVQSLLVGPAEKLWGERPASGSAVQHGKNDSSVMDRMKRELICCSLAFEDVFVFTWIERLEEIADTWQQISGGRCFRKWNRMPETSQPSSPLTYNSVVLRHMLPWVCPLQLFFLVLLSSQEWVPCCCVVAKLCPSTLWSPHFRLFP